MSDARLTATYAVRADARRRSPRAPRRSRSSRASRCRSPRCASPRARRGRRARRGDRAARRRRVRRRASRSRVETTGREPGQLMNMLFGNSSLHDDVELFDVELPPTLAARVRRPALRHRRHGAQRAGADGRAAHLLGAEAARASRRRSWPRIARHARARAASTSIKDDHGLADQASAPFRDPRRRGAARDRRRESRDRGPHASMRRASPGDLDAMRAQVEARARSRRSARCWSRRW